jgi:superfamily II DNA or RNA helicase
MHGMRSLADRCRASFSRNAWDLGEDLFRRRRVSIVDVDRDGMAADVVEGGAMFEVELEWSTSSDEFIDAICTCAKATAGSLCKHVAAVIQAAGRDPRVPRLAGSHNLLVLPAAAANEAAPSGLNRETLEQLLGGPNKAQALRAALGIAPLSPPAPKPAAQPRTLWRQALKELATPPKTESERERNDSFAAQKQRLFYRINVAEHRTGDRLLLDFVKRIVKRDGELGVPTSWSLKSDDIGSMADPADRELLALLLGSTPQQDSYRSWPSYSYRSSQSTSRCELSPATCALLLPKLAATGRLGWVHGRDPRQEEMRLVRWDDGPAWKFKLTLTEPQARVGRKLVAKLYREQEEADLTRVVLVLPGCILFEDVLARLDPSVLPQAIAKARRLREVKVPADQEDQFIEEVWQTPGLPQVELPDDLRWEQVRPEPKPRVSIGPVKIGSMTWLIGKLGFDYSGVVIDSEDTRQALCDANQRRIVHRDEAKEAAAHGELDRLGATPASYAERYHGTFKVARKDFAPLVVALNEAGWHVEAEGHILRRPGATHISLASGVDWFELDGHVDYEGEQVGLPKLLEALRRGEDFVTLDDGSRGMLPSEWLARYAPLAQMGEAEGDTLRFKPSQALLLDAWLSAQPEVDIDAAFKRVRERLRSFEGVPSHAEPAGFSGVLRPYQREGLGWLLFLEEFGFGGCLADDMGLGKTIQVLAMLVERRNRRTSKKARPPSLVVVPRSLVQNWIEEARRFAPELRVLDYTGMARIEAREQFDQFDVIVTTYGTLRRDAGHLKDMPFEYAILDEAQAIKNAASQAAKACRLVQSQHRLAMTGTPVENHLGELWSIFEFLNPGMLGRSNSLKLLSSKGTEGDAEGVRLLAKALRPFILRRTKEQVLSDLPEKTEQTLYCELDTQQRKLYDELRKHYRDALNHRIEKEGINKSKIHVLEALLRLRQAACHPGLLDKSKADEPSAKLETLLEQLEEVFNEGHKALVFSQFTSLLALVRKQLDKRNVVYEYLDGRTRDRQKRVDRFQTDPACPLFLISLKAGGLGLNLTAADYVFILDPWWNPAVEAQAVDRAHRIGQNRRVFAYRLIARDTVEEKILQLQGSKRKLAEAIISADNSLIGQLTADDLQVLLS